MKINEVEALVGITKKNIRFYEQQGLLFPKRNAENSYREYDQEDIRILTAIKLLRKLGLPIEEIRKMLSGGHTVADGMRRHLVSLERDKRNLQQSIHLCQQIQNLDIPIVELNAQRILEQMGELEREGTTFQNKQNQDIRTRYIAPVVVTVLVVAFMAAMCAFLLWAYSIAPEEAPPGWFIWMCVAMFGAVGAGVVLALCQRIREIGKGEIDDAKRY